MIYLIMVKHLLIGKTYSISFFALGKEVLYEKERI